MYIAVTATVAVDDRTLTSYACTFRASDYSHARHATGGAVESSTNDSRSRRH
jgi:hypothetical protein